MRHKLHVPFGSYIKSLFRPNHFYRILNFSDRYKERMFFIIIIFDGVGGSAVGKEWYVDEDVLYFQHSIKILVNTKFFVCSPAWQIE